MLTLRSAMARLTARRPACVIAASQPGHYPEAPRLKGRSMKRYVALFSIPGHVIDEWVRNTPADKREAMTREMMGAWQKWMTTNERSIVDKGMPLGKTKRVSAKGVADARNDLNWYLLVDAE